MKRINPVVRILALAFCLVVMLATVCIGIGVGLQVYYHTRGYWTRINEFKRLADSWDTTKASFLATSLTVTSDGQPDQTLVVLRDQDVSFITEADRSVMGTPPSNDYMHATGFMKDKLSRQLPINTTEPVVSSGAYTHTMNITRGGSHLLAVEIDTVQFDSYNWKPDVVTKERPVGCDESEVPLCTDVCRSLYNGVYGGLTGPDYCHVVRGLKSPLTLLYTGDGFPGEGVAGASGGTAVWQPITLQMVTDNGYTVPQPVDKASELQLFIRHQHDPWVYYGSIGYSFGAAPDEQQNNIGIVFTVVGVCGLLLAMCVPMLCLVSCAASARFKAPRNSTASDNPLYGPIILNPMMQEAPPQTETQPETSAAGADIPGANSYRSMFD